MLNNNSSNPIITIQLDQESSGHQYKQSLNSPLLKSKGVIVVTAIMETLTGKELPGRPNKASMYKSKYKSQKLVAKGPRPSQYECYSIVARMETYCSTRQEHPNAFPTRLGRCQSHGAR
jgi:hypothetical protein